jgi:pimeloyl-ACP methyl ester carboxylesterase
LEASRHLDLLRKSIEHTICSLHRRPHRATLCCESRICYMGSIVRELFAALLIIGTCLPSLAQERPHRPLIFVPGILGSRLCDANGTVVWGTGSSLVNFAKLELGRDGAEGIKSCGLIDKFQLLGSLLATNQYNTLLSALFQQGYLPQRRNLYIFDYDWRISNYENAERLDEFIRQRLPKETHFDIIAHSMGGIVSRIYMDVARATTSGQ